MLEIWSNATVSRADDADTKKGIAAGSDVARVRNTESLLSEKSDGGNRSEEENNNVPMSYSYFIHSNDSMFNDKEEMARRLLQTIAETAGTNVQNNAENVDKQNNNDNESMPTFSSVSDSSCSFRSGEPANEIEDGEFVLTASFPEVFMFGKAYNKWAADLTGKERYHLLNQFTTIPAQNRHLILYMFDSLRREASMRGMRAKVKSDRLSMEAWGEFLKDEKKSAALLSRAIVKPNDEEAQALLKKILPILNVAGSKTPWGLAEAKSMKSKFIEMSKRFGPATLMFTLSPADLDNPNALRLTFRSIDNKTFPATMLADEDGSKIDMQKLFREESTKVLGSGTILCGERKERAKRAMDNPVAYVMEYKNLCYDVYSALVGIAPNGYSVGSDGRTVRNTTYWKHRPKGVFGNALAIQGVQEASSRGTLHSHAVIWGGIPPRILQSYSGVQEICDAISSTLNSMYRAELPAPLQKEHMLKEAISEIHSERFPKEIFDPEKSVACTLVDLDEQLEKLCLSHGIDNGGGKYTKELIDLLTLRHVLNKQMHSHTYTCYYGFNGLSGCRVAKPSGLAEKTGPVILEPIKEETETGDVVDGYLVKKEIPPPDFTKTRDPLDPPDSNLVVWEFQRSVVESLPSLDDKEFVDENSKREFMVVGLELEDHPKVSEWLMKLPLSTLESIYRNVSEKLVDGNGLVVEHSPTLSYATGSHSHTSYLGGTEQSVSAIYYMADYLSKTKVSTEQSLLLLCSILSHVNKHPSKSPTDSGTNVRTAQHTFTRLLNQMNLKMEITDYQAAASLIGMPTEISSETFTYISPQHHLAFRLWDKNRDYIEQQLDRNEMQECHDATTEFVDGAIDQDDDSDEEDHNDNDNYQDNYSDLRDFIVSDSAEEDSSQHEAKDLVVGNHGFSEKNAQTAETHDTLDRDRCNRTSLLDSATKELSIALLQKSEEEFEEEIYGTASTVGDLDDTIDSTLEIGDSEPALCSGVCFDIGMFENFGPAPTYLIDPDDSRKKIPVPYPVHYRFRGKELRYMNLEEYTSLVEIKPKRSANKEKHTTGKMPATQFEFGDGHPLKATHAQFLRAKQHTLIYCRKKPLLPKRRPDPETCTKEVWNDWQRKADAFAKYYLTMFRAESDIYDMSSCNTLDYDWNAFQEWKSALIQDPSLLSRLRRMALHNHVHSLTTTYKSKKLFQRYRNRNRTIWTQKQKSKYERQKYQEEQELHDDRSKIAEAIFEQQHNKLPTASMNSIKLMLEDDRQQMKVLQKYYKGILQAETASKRAVGDPSSNSIPYNTKANADVLLQESELADVVLKADNISNFAKSEDFEINTNVEGRPPDGNSDGSGLGIDLNEEQKEVFDMCKEGFKDPRNMPNIHLVTGPPGTGKTHLTNAIRQLADFLEGGHVLSTSFNGIAAVMAGGNTLSSIARSKKGEKIDQEAEGCILQIPPLDSNELVAFINEINLTHLALIIIDEISTTPVLMLVTLHE